jgi:poly(hydroxyalkanoate) depolymerase family esterase
MKRVFGLFIFCFLFSQILLAKPSPYKLVVPIKPSAKPALFVVLHGCLTEGADMEVDTKYSEYAEQRGFYVMYPEPSEDTYGCWRFFDKTDQVPGTSDSQDLIDAIREVQIKYNLPSDTTYGIGISAGASILNVISSCYPNVLSGIAVHSGMAYGLTPNWQSSLLVAQAGPLPIFARNKSCDPQKYRGKVMVIQGTRDNVMNPRHYPQLIEDYFSHTRVKTTNYVTVDQWRYPYTQQNFYRHHQLVGIGILVDGMNHEWSGPRGPDVSNMIMDYFLGSL